jgi:hypothetical protein
VPIVIIGTDAVLAAAPATPVQLAHACLRAGFANVVPASWGDELVAAAVLRRLPNYGSGPVIQCSCPIVAHRLLTAGGDLRPVLLPVVSPPVAVARYVRTLAQPTRTRITYVGACPGAVDESIDIRMTPDALFAMLAERDIVIDEQPRVFESVIPPDRRRYRSQPGGVPTAEALWTELGARTLVEIDGDDFISEVAQQLLSGKNVLIDTAARLGCACSGAVGGEEHPRSAVTAVEPPRSTTPVVDEQAPISLDLPVPAASRTPVDVVAVPTTPPSSRASMSFGASDGQLGNRFSPVRASGLPPEPRAPRVSNPIPPRAVLSAFPVARDVDGKSLPRAYVARRRTSPKGVSFSLTPEEIPVEPTPSPADPSPAPPPQNTQPVRARSAAPGTGRADVRPVETRPPALPPLVLSPEPSATQLIVSPEPASVIVSPDPAPMPSSAVIPDPVPASAVSKSYTPDVTPAPALRPVVQERALPAPAAQPHVEPTPKPRPEPDDSSPRRSRDARPQPQAAWTLSRGQLIGILIAIVMIAISVSTVVGIIVGRSVSASINTPVGR